MTQAAINVGLSGKFKLVATNSKGQERVVANWFDNLILDSGLNRMGTGGIIDRISVGSGNSTPTVGQTALDAFVASTTTGVGTTDGYDSVGNEFAFRRMTFRFNAGVAAGNLAEVGAGWSGGLFNRALIKDAFGNPTTVTVLADESLDVIYELRVYIPADVVSTVNISGVTYNTVLRAENINQNSIGYHWNFYFLVGNGMDAANNSLGAGAYSPGALGTVLQPPGGSYIVSVGSSETVGAYVNNSYERKYRNTFGLDRGNAPFGNISFHSRLGAFKASFDPPIPKDNTKVLTIDWKVSWARRP